MEAMAAGLPVVATEEGCTPDLIRGREGGILVKNGDYTSAVKTLLTDERLHRHCQKTGRERINDFRWDVVSQRYAALYQASSTRREP